MSTLIIDRKNLSLNIDGNVLVFHENGQRSATMPLAIIERICIKGDLALSASVLGKLGDHGIGVVVLSGHNRHAALFMPNARKDALRRLAQAHFSVDAAFALARAKSWVEAKIHRQYQLLLHCAQQPHIAVNTLHHPLKRLENALAGIGAAVSIPALRGVEGSAAAAYFSGLASYLPGSLGFHERNRKPPRDPFNVVLSLGYTLLHFEMVRQIHLVGLDPCIGFYHGLAHGRESLACDLVEPMRPYIDQFAIDLFHQRTLRPEDFSKRGQACHMGKSARARFYPAFEQAAREWRKEMREHCLILLHALGDAAVRHPRLCRHVLDDAFEEEAELRRI